VRAPAREPPTASAMLAKVRADVFQLPRYALHNEVRIEVGADVPELRTADGVVVDTQAGESWYFIALECKRFRADLRWELEHPEKAAPHDQVCAERYFVLPAGRKLLLPGDELPDGVGLIEVGSSAVVLKWATPHRVDPPSINFLKAIYRAGATVAERLERDDAATLGAPLVPIVRVIDRSHVALACGHSTVRPIEKHPRPRLPCFACLAGLPVECDLVLDALGRAGPEDLAAYLRAIDERAAREAPRATRSA
jgi:hypothetical protein